MDDDEFARFVTASSRQLLRTAWLLTGDWALAEDLVQTALLAIWRRGPGGAVERPEAYARRVLVTTYLRWRKRRWSGEIATGRLPDRPAEDPGLERLVLRSAVTAALDVLPPAQRAVVVLRFFADQSEAQTAAAMGCPVGTVKSRSAKALARLRDIPELAEIMSEGRTS